MSDDPTQPAPRPTTGLAWGITTPQGSSWDRSHEHAHKSPLAHH